MTSFAVIMPDHCFPDEDLIRDAYLSVIHLCGSPDEFLRVVSGVPFEFRHLGFDELWSMAAAGHRFINPPSIERAVLAYKGDHAERHKHH